MLISVRIEVLIFWEIGISIVHSLHQSFQILVVQGDLMSLQLDQSSILLKQSITFHIYWLSQLTVQTTDRFRTPFIIPQIITFKCLLVYISFRKA